MNQALGLKLFALAKKRSRLYAHPQVVPLCSLAPLPELLLFRSGERRRILELGCGSGEFLFQWLSKNPEDDYITFEIKAKRIAKTLRHASQIQSKPHLRIIACNFQNFLEEILPPHSFDMVIVNFPDPWPKRRHWKHRLVQKDFDKKIQSLLRFAGSKLYLATDYGPYARKMLACLRNSKYFLPVYPWPHYLRTHPEEMPYSYFEKIHLEAGRRPYYMAWQLQERP